MVYVSETIGNNKRERAQKYCWPGPLVAVQVFDCSRQLRPQSPPLTHLQNWGRRIKGTLAKYFVHSIFVAFLPSTYIFALCASLIQLKMWPHEPVNSDVD